ncbi:cubilin-like [Pecten maximus]|uniref:cubilin-like n=1 Tax=Pecten maximus TaxID=6579 RepID=UPI00145907A8|nr:cubilin-like [Pecten maximus]
MADPAFRTVWIVLIVLTCVCNTVQNTRQKRQISPHQPKIITTDGHLVFETGINHNITFKSTAGGYVNVNGENLVSMVQMVKTNKQAIDELKAFPTEIPSNIEGRLESVEGRLNNLQPTGEVQNQLISLANRLGILETANLVTRLATIEQQMTGLQNIPSSVTTLTSQVSSLQRSVDDLQTQITEANGNMDLVSDIDTMVRTLQRQVANLRSLLTQNECSSNPCRNGGTCIDRYNAYSCRCPPAWTGETCDEDVNECSEYTGTDRGCQNGATCVNNRGSFTCQCTSNYHGIRCTETHDDCTGASNQELCGHGTCVNTGRVIPGQPKYHCICEDGWTTSGSDPACNTDVNECDTDRPAVCSADPLVPCINVPGTFYCGQCPTGYSGNGFTCADINECATNNGGCSLSPRVDCVNTRGSRSCGPCPSGYVGNGETCSWVGVCNTNNGGCHPQASCQESPGVLTCTCPPGYVGNGIGTNGCVSQGPITGPCGSNPCRNGAACQTNGNTFLCVCIPGYEGNQCETNTNECASNPCQNGGTCTDQVNGYSCQCDSAYSGNNCQDEQNACGGRLYGETGTITYPATPGATYPHGLSCAYRIISTPGLIVSLTFTSFNVEAHATCGYDFLQINDGPTAASYALGRYCGSSLPNSGQPINTTQHQMYLWFFTDVSVSNTGFSATWTSAPPVCGGRLAGQTHGSINSPGYPGTYPHDRTCSWEIAVPLGNNIMFTFATLALESHPNCSYDYLEIRDGPLPTSQLLQRYCNTTQPPPLSTTGPNAFVKFHSDASLTDNGFHITYVAISAGDQCGGQLTGETGTLTSPNYPSYYDHNGYCAWTITVSTEDSITLTFTDMALEGGSCSYDYVEVRDGSDENAPLFGRYCGTSIPSILRSSGNVMFIEFRTDGSVRNTGFRADWTTACGGVYTALQGNLQSPNYPNAYPASKECIYSINQPNGNSVTLTFTAFDVEGSSGGLCAFDYVEVRDGGSETSPLLGHFCGAEIPDPISTTQNLMWVKFVTDSSIQNLGFAASYISARVPCGSFLTDPSGTFQSPGHPNIYPHGANCTWQISVSAGLVIRLTFQTFILEGHGSSCYFDYVDVYDNSSAVLSSRLGRYCGNTIPPSMTSTGNVMTVTFTADSSIAYEGFTASYVSLNASTVCGGTLTTSTGIITSPNFPSNYPHNRQCIWTIIAPNNIQILLNITDFQMESHANCVFDFLEIRNGGFENSPLVNRYCGNTIDTIIQSHSNRMFIKFQTDSSFSARGFRILYEATATGCGGDFTTPTGSFISPNYPNTYPHNAECFWTITASRGSQIVLNITDIDMEGGSSCYFDYILIRDGSSSGRQLGKFCGTSTPDAVHSSSNSLWIKYRTDYSVAGRGFHISYRSVCNVRLTDFTGVIESPNFPQPYPHNRNCTWIIETSMGNTITAAFSHFDVETHHSCSWDYLQIRDGELASSTSLGKFCGTNLPAPVNSTSNKMRVHFMSDFSVASNGFRLEYIFNGCGGYLMSPSGNFTSPNYPGNYPNHRVCEWLINIATGMRIELTLNDFDFETHSTCAYDGLEIYGGMDSASPLLMTLCHTQTQPQVYTATGNQMFIRFRSDISVPGRGFHASYRSLLGGCGGNFSTPAGTLTSANFPNNYPHNTECVWLITVAPSTNILITFNEFELEGSSTCPFDYVKIFDGPSINNTMLMSHCGSSLPSPPSYRSSGNQMLVRMRTDSSVSRKGFNATYVTGCGGTLSAEQNGEIISPNYPDNYGPQNNCSWLIRADHSVDRVTLTFTHMDTEFYASCIHDYVSVYNGDDDDAPLIGTYCGSTVPAPITSLGSALFVRFVSDPSVQRTGFRAVYTKSSSSCGGEFTAERGSFMSPGYPTAYPPSTECVWTFIVSPGNRLMVSFSVFSLEDNPSCNFDYVELRETDVNGDLIGRYCSTNLPSNLTSYQGLWMKFRSDDIPGPNAIGFLGQYSPVYGGELTGSSGRLASPLYPRQYPHNADYTWTITVDTNMRIRVAFTAMDMEFRQTGCVFDYLLFRDGGLADSPELGRYCGLTIPDPVLTTTNQLRVEFHTDFSASGQGFLFDWQATNEVPPTALPPGVSTTPVPGCGGTLNPSEYQMMTVISPGYPNGYADNLDCVWHVTVQTGSVVWFNITDINMEGGSCGYDYLAVYDGPVVNGNYGPTLGRFCGRFRNSQPIKSTFSQMTLRFKTDFSVNRTGVSFNIQAVCGGILRMQSGIIQSPLYPSSYPNNLNCTWHVYVTNGRTIGVEFIGPFNVIGSGEACGGDSVQLLGGPSITSPPIGSSLTGKYCGNVLPPAMNTSSNYLTVRFVSDATGASNGFKLQFTEVSVTCGDTLYLTNGVTSGYFTSPNYPDVYPHNVDCTWVITAPASQSIQLDFVDNFYIEDHNQCQFDYVEVRDGGTVNSPVIAHVCGSSLPSTVKSSGNVMFVRFRTDISVVHVGFRAMYKISECGGRVYGVSGTIMSPNFPDTYPSNSDCVWNIEAPTGHYLTFTFNSFNLVYAYDCTLDDVDFLEIREFNSTGPVLLRACSSSLPSPIDTSDSFALVRFKSNSGHNQPGFSLSFQASIEVCGGMMTSPTGTFTSPNFPGQYAHSRVCVWTIMVQQGRRVSLTFDSFNLEYGSNCRFDFVAIYDGILADSPIRTRFCGATIPELQESSGNTMKVVFRTDGSVSNGGFRASYTSNNEQVCGGPLSTPGIITSPGFEAGSNYTNSHQCVWLIVNQNFTNTSMALSFNSFQIESHSNCNFDFLEIREGYSETGSLIGKYCGTTVMPSPIYTPSPQLWVRFRTDSSIVDRGFSLNYGFTDCGGILTQNNGVITSPNFPSLYNHSDSCAWHIQAPEGFRINVQFTDFNIETHPNCVFDYVEVLNGPYYSSPSVGKYCGTTLPPAFTSQSRAIRVYFKSDISISRQGFRLTYFFQSGGCGGLFHSNDGQIMSPNYPQSYPHRTECVWDINVSPGYHVALTFTPPFDLESHASCSWDYVEVNDGLWNGSLVPLGRWCSNLTPPQQNSTTNRLVVKFRSDINTNGNGFSANWTVGCGSIFTSENGRIVSPGYPEVYGNHQLCNYTIISDPQRFIVLRFSVFDLEGGSSCPYDYLDAFAGNNSLGRRLGRFCGNVIPQAISSLGVMFLQFRTDLSIVGHGFSLNYRTSECGGNFTSPYGFIRTPQQPSIYHHNANCSWLITVAPDRVVYFKFTSFDLEAHSSCNYDYVDLRDGPDLSSPLIGRYCGTVVPDMIRTTSNILLVNFISDYSVAGRGFTAGYRTGFGVNQGCGGTLNATSGSFGSIDIDGDGQYENRQDCIWTIIVGRNHLVVLTIASIDIEMQSTCYFDGIKIYDGMGDTDPQIGTYCGTNAPGVVRSTSNALTVRFYTDGSVTGIGFNATYRQELAFCGQTLISSDHPQTVSSPTGPLFPPQQPVQCRWTVDAPVSTQRVRFTMTTINLDSHANCTDEYVEFRDSPLGYGGRSMHYCGTTPPSMFESVGQTAQINYKAMGTRDGHGFSLTYQTATCNRTYSGYSGQIHGPGWPGNYPSNIYCEILITGPPNTWITLYFNTFSIESHRSCRFDYLQIRNGSTVTDPVAATLCGFAIPDPIFGTGNSLWMAFRTDGSITHPGFDITYTASTAGMGCGGNITGINGSLTSPGYPGNYTERHSCRWLITVPGRRVVRATFTDLNLIGSPDCNRDSVAVYNGNSDQQPIFGRYCGNETPAPLVASGNVMLVKFTTDGIGSAPGFRLTFTS